MVGLMKVTLTLAAADAIVQLERKMYNKGVFSLWGEKF
jgi:hypothetical protein